jgi:hypothetical protein
LFFEIIRIKKGGKTGEKIKIKGGDSKKDQWIL